MAAVLYVPMLLYVVLCSYGELTKLGFN